MAKTTRKALVLLIEDNIGFRFLFKNALEFLGHQVLEAEDGELGLQITKNRHPDLILLDLMIPKLHGFELLKELKRDPLTERIPVIILSVLSEPKDIQKSKELGASDYIVKGSESPEQIVRKSCAFLANV